MYCAYGFALAYIPLFTLSALIVNAYATRVEAVAASYLNVGGICCLVYTNKHQNVKIQGWCLNIPCSSEQDGGYATR